MSGSITFETSNIDSHVFKRIVEALLDYGWSSDDEGKISFMIGDFDWCYTELSENQEVMQKISLNIDNNVPTGLTLLWKDTGIGGSFLYINPEEIMFSLIVRPLLLNELKMIDFSWYIKKLIPVFDIIYIVRVNCMHEN